MRIVRIAATVAAVVCMGLGAEAASMTASGSRDALLAPVTLARWSVGFDYENINRDIKRSGRSDATLEADTYAGFLGYDATGWLTLFLTAGGTKVDLPDPSAEGGDQFKWSGGLGANLWHFDVRDPEFAAGRLSIRALCEYARYTSGDSDYEVQWSEFSLALPVGYELFAESMTTVREVPFSLMLSAGPVLSVIDGDWDEPAAQSSSFHEDSSLGVMGRADVFLSSNLSVGGQAQYFGAEYTASGFLRYHFR